MVKIRELGRLIIIKEKYAQQSIGAMPADDRKDSVLSSIEELL